MSGLEWHGGWCPSTILMLAVAAWVAIIAWMFAVGLRSDAQRSIQPRGGVISPLHAQTVPKLR